MGTDMRDRRFSWLQYSFPVGSLAGVRIGVHWSFPAFLVLYAFSEGTRLGAEWGWLVAVTFLLLFVIVLAHEFGHVFAARSEGLPADSVSLWPLGGLTHLGEEATGLAEVKVAGAGPAVNAAFLLLLLPVLAFSGVRIGVELMNPFVYWPVPVTSGAPTFWQQAVHSLFKANLLVTLFNLLPSLPLDGGRVLRGLLHRRLGRIRSVLVVTLVSYALAVALIVLAFVFGELILGIVAAFVGIGAWYTRRQVVRQMAAEEQEEGFLGYDFSMGHTSLERSLRKAEGRQSRREQKEQRKREQKQREDREIDEEVDRLLEKISRQGMDSLTRRERAFLERASRRKRSGS